MVTLERSLAPGRSSGAFGPDYPDHGWAPAPRYIMRRDRVLRFFANRAPGRVLEIGSATGALLSELAGLGHSCVGLETSMAARATAEAVNGHTLQFHAAAASDWESAFDTIMSLEVLEHIEDDVGALRSWAKWLRPGGVAILSVPADPTKWNGSDVWAGHYRRYTEESLYDLVNAAGLAPQRCERYGYPVANIVESIRASRLRRYLNKTQEEIERERRAGTAQSGVKRDVEMALYPYYRSGLGALALKAAIALQGLFAGTRFGNGLIMIAEKPADRS